MKHTDGNWSIGKNGGEVISNSKKGLNIGGAFDDTCEEYYGGYLIGESISKCNLNIIVAAPKMLEALKQITQAYSDTLEMEYGCDAADKTEEIIFAKQVIEKAES